MSVSPFFGLMLKRTRVNIKITLMPWYGQMMNKLVDVIKFILKLLKIRLKHRKQRKTSSNLIKIEQQNLKPVSLFARIILW